MGGKKTYAMRMVRYGYTIILKIASFRAKIIFGQLTKINKTRRLQLMLSDIHYSNIYNSRNKMKL